MIICDAFGLTQADVTEPAHFPAYPFGKTLVSLQEAVVGAGCTGVEGGTGAAVAAPAPHHLTLSF